MRRTVEAALKRKIECVTLFSFSSENWSRPVDEVEFLFGLLRLFIRRDLADLHRQGVKVRVIGSRDRLPSDILSLIAEAERLTAGNTKLTLVVAFNYGSRDEIVRAVRSIAGSVKSGSLDPAAIDEAALKRKIECVTLFSFSSENWSRPADEVEFLFGLLRLFIRRDLADLHRQGVKVRVIGSRDRLPADILSLIAEAERLTADNSKLTLVVAFNYGSRDEIVRAVRSIAGSVKSGSLDPAAIDEATLAARLDTAAFPDLDLLIRTSGEYRLSNFLLWQAAYAELVFQPVLWPDFDSAAFDAALDEYATRGRRFGGIAAGSGV